LPDPDVGAGIAKDRYARNPRRKFFQQLQPFGTQAVIQRDETGGVAAGPCQTRNKACADRVDDPYKYDWYRAGLLLERRSGWTAMGEYDVWRERN
jgi:hypothetical protein